VDCVNVALTVTSLGGITNVLTVPSPLTGTVTDSLPVVGRGNHGRSQDRSLWKSIRSSLFSVF